MYQRILVPVDGSLTSNAGLAEAVKLAKLTGARLLLLHVVDDMPMMMSAEGLTAMSGDIFAILKEGGEKVLEQARVAVASQGLAVDTKLLESLNGRLCDHVNQQVTGWKADLIVLGTHGRRGASRWLLGSDAEQVLHSAAVPVLLIRAEAVP